MFAVNAVAVATPLAPVVACVVFVVLANFPLAPVVGAVNVTTTPGTGLLLPSSTVTASTFPNAVPTVADCGVVPALVVIDDAAPALTAMVPEVPVIELFAASVAVIV